jgi:hypothetical protein
MPRAAKIESERCIWVLESSRWQISVQGIRGRRERKNEVAETVAYHQVCQSK